MLYNIIINQKSIIDNKLNVTANHIAVMEVVVNFILSNKAQVLVDNSGSWSWVSYELIVEQIPMFGIKKDRCRQLVKDLCNEGLLESNPNNQNLGRVYLRVGSMYYTYKNFENPLLKNSQGTLDKSSDTLAKKLATPCEKISDDNSTNNNIHKPIINNNSDSVFLEKKEKDIHVEIPKTKLEIAFDDFVEMRKKAKKSPTPRAIELLKLKLNDLANDDVAKIKILEQSTINNWQDLYPLNSNKNNFKHGAGQQYSQSSERDIFDKP